MIVAITVVEKIDQRNNYGDSETMMVKKKLQSMIITYRWLPKKYADNGNCD